MTDEATEIEKSVAERELEDVIKQMGLIITSENPEERHGTMNYYKIKARKIDASEDEKPVSGLAVDRVNALKAIIVMSNAT